MEKKVTLNTTSSRYTVEIIMLPTNKYYKHTWSWSRCLYFFLWSSRLFNKCYIFIRWLKVKPNILKSLHALIHVSASNHPKRLILNIHTPDLLTSEGSATLFLLPDFLAGSFDLFVLSFLLSPTSWLAPLETCFRVLWLPDELVKYRRIS